MEFQRRLDLATCMKCGTVRPMPVAARERWSIVHEGDAQVGTLCLNCQTPDEKAPADNAATDAVTGMVALQHRTDGELGVVRGMVYEEFVAAMGRIAPRGAGPPPPRARGR